MYGVVVCPNCRKAKGVALSQKTTTCACGFEILVVPAKVRTRVATARELAPLVGRTNARLAGGTQAYERDAASPRRRRSRDVYARVAAAATGAGDRAHRVRAAAMELTKELEVFSTEDWRRTLEGLGIPDPDERLEELLRDSTVFEPRAGFFRAVRLTP